MNNMEIQYYEHTCLCGCGGKIEIKKSHKYGNIPQYINGHNSNTGKYQGVCSIKTCNNKAIAFNLCNGHYLQKRKGKEFTSNIKEHKKDRICKFENCNEYTKKHGGYGFCKKHYTNYRREERTKYLVELLGNKCLRCNLQYPVVVYDFHHIDPKTKNFGIGEKINNCSMDLLIEEVKKCELLCSNCHRIKTFGGDI